MKDLILFDLDGTLADNSHRQHLLPDWRAFFAACDRDLVNTPVAWLWDALRFASKQMDPRVSLWIVSGRSDEVRTETVAWLDRHGIRPEQLLMRSFMDHRPDDVLKKEWAVKHNLVERTLFVVDDRSKTVRMWRELGIPCFQVNDGDF